MTIKEAAQLVMQSQSININGIIFLDMGSPKNIYDIAKKIILASGLSYKDRDNQDGEIEIIETGLRKGEKLKEKLTYSKLKKTSINKVLIANEQIKDKKIFYKLDKLINNFQIVNINRSINNLKKLIKFNKKNSIIWIWIYWKINYKKYRKRKKTNHNNFKK